MEIYIYMVIIVIIIIILVWIYERVNRGYNEEEMIRKQKVKETIKWLYKCVNDICYSCDMAPVYEIKESFQITYSEKNINRNNIKGMIYVVIWNDKYSRVFNRNTLIYAVLHEIAHILSPSIQHKDPFDAIEKVLLNKAIELSYYDPNIPMEENYLTLDIAR